MGLSRKRKKELRKLKGHAEELWQEQQQVLDRATSVIREASRQAGHLTREEVVPRVQTTYDERFRPGVERGRAVTNAAVNSAKHTVVDEVLPAVAGVVGSALSVVDAVRGRTEKTAEVVTKKAKKATKNAKKAIGPKKSGPGAGTFVLVGLGVVALAGLAYAAWQTFRADDDLWIADDEPEAAPGDVPPTTPAA
ncbi:hypothetical protein [Herbiconiux sp. L3-i23]|uniref:hypothetical protein n=1 Tax=Herbiconiux sp. L3-i23 TaxID=2905871 RepID=UPI002062E86B|nr:hypothetical protein [Herbiconiux sp. L3-i23]BDI21234.1 hypothetical protein L3i23_00100 [Herbiconiux sp. L3-i23]